jgi:hypothetical protein
MKFTLNLTHLATDIPASEPLSSLEAMWWLASLAADESRDHVKSYLLEDRVFKSVSSRTGIDYNDGNWEIDGVTS